MCIFLILISNLWRRGGQLLLILLVTIILGAIASNNYFVMLAGNLHINEHVVKKIGHLSLFFLLGFVSTRWLGARVETPDRPSLLLPYPILIFSGLFLFAAITEFVQFLTIDRNPSFLDLLIDMIGAIIGIRALPQGLRPVVSEVKFNRAGMGIATNVTTCGVIFGATGLRV